MEAISRKRPKHECGNVSQNNRTLCISGASAEKHPVHLDNSLTGWLNFLRCLSVKPPKEQVALANCSLFIL